MQYAHDKDQAKQYTQAALARIDREGLPQTPDMIELWYVYYSGQSPEISRAIDILASNRQPVTLDRCKELHYRFLSEARTEEVVRRAGDQINQTLQSVNGVVRGVREATSEYSDRLGGINEQIGGISDPNAMRAFIDSVINDTQNMLSRSEELQAELDRSSRIMEELQRDLDNVRKEAMTDGLTGLSNRKSFDAAIRRVSEEAAESGMPYSLLMVDIDHFKSFNDNFGHQIGDQVLRLVARTLTDGVKGRDIACRYGGEEFAIILPETPLEAAITVGNALRRAIATKDVINRNTGEKLGRITMSVGAAEYNGGEDPADLIERADAALYTAKHNGRNQVAAAPTPAKSLTGGGKA